VLDGVTPFPAEFAARYRALGYWEDRPLFDGFTAALAAHADRVAVADEAGPVTYRPPHAASTSRPWPPTS
jgi:2,3-dihydroxybenzoate-AMP ligase